MADGSPQSSVASTVFGTPGVLALLDPIKNPQWWDVVNVAGVVSPAVCEVGEFTKGNEWDVKKGKGSNGATLTFVQRKPAKGKIKFYLWTSQHFVQWSTFYAVWKYDPTKKKTQAVDVFHPSLAAIELSAFVTEEITNIIHEGNGKYSMTVSLLEYFPPPPDSAVSTPDGSKDGPGPTIPGADGPQSNIDKMNEEQDASNDKLSDRVFSDGQKPG